MLFLDVSVRERAHRTGAKHAFSVFVTSLQRLCDAPTPSSAPSAQRIHASVLAKSESSVKRYKLPCEADFRALEAGCNRNHCRNYFNSIVKTIFTATC